VTVYTDERWVVEDKLISKEPHIYCLHWLLPDWEWEVANRESGFEIRLKSPFGWITLHITTDSQLPINNSSLGIVRAGEVVFGQHEVQPFEGWVSPIYGTKNPALSLAFEMKEIANARFLSEFIFPA